MNYKVRVLDELLYISDKISRLNSYLQNTVRKENDEQIKILARQEEVMTEYQQILIERLRYELTKGEHVSNSN